MLQIFGTNFSRPYASKADRQAVHASRLQIVSAATSTFAVRASATSSARKTSRARQTIEDSAAKREEIRVQAQVSGLAFERNPSKIREERMQEQRRLSAVKKEIEADMRQRTWLTSRD